LEHGLVDEVQLWVKTVGFARRTAHVPGIMSYSPGRSMNRIEVMIIELENANRPRLNRALAGKIRRCLLRVESGTSFGGLRANVRICGDPSAPAQRETDTPLTNQQAPL